MNQNEILLIYICDVKIVWTSNKWNLFITLILKISPSAAENRQTAGKRLMPRSSARQFHEIKFLCATSFGGSPFIFSLPKPTFSPPRFLLLDTCSNILNILKDLFPHKTADGLKRQMRSRVRGAVRK